MRAESPSHPPANRSPARHRKRLPTAMIRAVGAYGILVCRFPGALPQAGINRAFGPKIKRAMPQSLSLVIVHVIFSTKERRPFLDPDTRPKLHAYLATVARNEGCEAYRVGGVGDHVHLAIRLSRTKTIADLVESLKSSSSKWVKTQ